MSDRTKKIEAIFHAASGQNNPEERESYLNEACLGDETLRKDVEALLQAALAGEALFRKHDDSLIKPLTEQPGVVIGRYKLLEKIGEGGMGVVYMAEQEEPVRRKVALKIIKLGMDTHQVIARFEAERQALAMMDHPHIAQVLDAGATETGRPYFVMELVQGVPITDFTEANKLSIEERLKLFLPVCNAIQSAHQKGIIHRDIKPTNVLVTMHNGAPHPMVIDFGVAKATNQKLTEKTLFTNFATMIGTPAYMSPEQAEMSKLDVDTRSDIYSLGILLYELLTGTTPFPEERLRGVAYGEMQRIIIEEEPERPSTRLKKKSIGQSENRNKNPAVDSDLDSIVMKCLEKDRDRRYETANGLAADVNRHLSNEPIVARPPSATYRFRKFVRRNKLQFASAAIVAFVLISASFISMQQAIRANRAEGIAKAEAVKSREAEQIARELASKATQAEQKATEQAESAQAIKSFLLENIAGNNLVDLNADSYEISIALVKRIAEQMEGRFTNQPHIEAEIRRSLMNGLMSARDIRGGVEQAGLLLNLQKRLLPPYHTDTVTTIMTLASAKYQMGQREEGLRLLRDSMNSIRALNPPNAKGVLASIEGAYGLLLIQEGRTEEALRYLRESRATARSSGTNSADTIYWTAALAESLENARQLEEAESLWREGLELCRQNPNVGLSHRRALDNRFGVGRILVRQRRTDEALSLLPQVIASYERRFGTNYYITLRAHAWLAMALDQKGETNAVTRLYADMYPRLIESMHHVHARYSFEEMAEFFIRQRNFSQATLAYDALRQIYATVPPKNGSELDWFLRTIAATKGWEGAAEFCRQNFDLLSDSLLGWLNKGWIFQYAGDDDSYQRVVRKILAIPQTSLATNELHLPIEIAALGLFNFSAEQIAELDSRMNTLDAAQQARDKDNQFWGYRAIGHLQLQLGRLDKCIGALEKAERVQQSPDPYHLFIKAMCLHRLQRDDEARAALAQAEAIIKPQLGESFSQIERFLPTSQIYQHIVMHREAKGAHGVK